MTDRGAIDRYLRQVAELGGPELYLETLGRRDAICRGVGGHGPETPPVGPTGLEALRRAVSPDGGSTHNDTIAMSRPTTRRSADSWIVAELGGLAEVASGCVLCRLHETRRTVVFGEGSPAADLVVVGEAPGQEEDRTGRPFVGRAGRLLDLMLMAAGFPREDVYICNVLKCRPPDNRNPQADEMDTCTRNYLHRQLELISPRVLLAVGRFAVQALLDTTSAISRLRGRLHAYRGIPLVVSYHPAYLLRSPNMVRTAWSDYQLIRSVLDDPA